MTLQGGDEVTTGDHIELDRVKAGGNVIAKQDNSTHYHLASRAQADRIEEVGRAFHEAACRYRSQTAAPVTTLGLIGAISLTGKLVDTDAKRQDAEQLVGHISRAQLAGLRAFEDSPAELAPAELRPAADNLRAVCAPLYPAADEVCRAAVSLHLALMKGAETLREPPHPFVWREPDEAVTKHEALKESIGRFADALSARLEG
ncbi:MULTISPECIES: hypothetical protein [Nocardiopsis]|uniref:Uncharacterized protein n=1 Tax=Nocardiopsis sinuspersici TaxID=501010 RepID=A0A1V3BW65_9ACTN|nr:MULTISPECIES: hypothetical protein [Nocardiopsis]OOC52416.1 hypothetical protein NOSIN_00025 [Nocardiopsis sinuspersici]